MMPDMSKIDFIGIGNSGARLKKFVNAFMNFWVSRPTSNPPSIPERTPPGLRAFRCCNPAPNESMKAVPRFPG